MLHTIRDLEDFTLHAAGDNIGLVKDFFVDDQQWMIQYCVVALGARSSAHKVLVSPRSITKMNREEKTLSVNLSLVQIKTCPDIDTNNPILRQNESHILQHYDLPFFWNGANVGSSELAVAEGAKNSIDDEQLKTITQLDGHLRSCKLMVGYNIQATDGDIGEIKEMLIDEDTWQIRYLVIDTNKWWFGKQVIIAPSWIENISWEDGKATVNLTQQSIKESPIYDPTIPFNRQNEENLHLHYGRGGYWES